MDGAYRFGGACASVVDVKPNGKGEHAADFGFARGQVVQEYYVDEDADPDVRIAIEEATGNSIVDDSYGDVADGALIWWRAEDFESEDLTDLLVDATANLDNGGLIWVLTPKPGTPGHVRPAEIVEAAKTAGLSTTTATSVCPGWSGVRLTARGRR
ncbi:Protein of unknown function [Ruaniaceae bacterium KH17]|nr:Protein of unknown function [Ruaniaceae bacterium KH17]